MIEEALWRKINLGLAVLCFVEGLRNWLIILACFITLDLLVDLLDQVLLSKLVLILILDHVLMFARFAEHWKNVYFIEFVLIWNIWQGWLIFLFF